jgi:hypothetical protein
MALLLRFEVVVPRQVSVVGGKGASGYTLKNQDVFPYWCEAKPEDFLD